MTPNNIAGMARLKGLDVIAVSDHNSAKNLPAIQKAADICGLLLLPAIEAETREEVHVLCYLPTVDAALALGDALYARLPDVPNMPAFFGEQAVMDENDEIIATEPKLLIQSTDFSIEELASLYRAHGGAPVPARQPHLELRVQQSRFHTGGAALHRPRGLPRASRSGERRTLALPRAVFLRRARSWARSSSGTASSTCGREAWRRYSIT